MQNLIKYANERKALKEKMKKLNIDFTKYGENLPVVIPRFIAKKYCFLTKREMEHLILLADNQEKLEKLFAKYIHILKEASKLDNDEYEKQKLVAKLETVEMEFNKIYEESLQEIKKFESQKKKLPI